MTRLGATKDLPHALTGQLRGLSDPRDRDIALEVCSDDCVVASVPCIKHLERPLMHLRQVIARFWHLNLKPPRPTLITPDTLRDTATVDAAMRFRASPLFLRAKNLGGEFCDDLFVRFHFASFGKTHFTTWAETCQAWFTTGGAA